MKSLNIIVLLALLIFTSLRVLAAPREALEVNKVRLVITSGERSGVGLGVGGERPAPGLVYLELLNEKARISYKIPVELKLWRAGAVLELPNIRLGKIMTVQGFEGRRVKDLLTNYFGSSLGLSVGLGASVFSAQSLRGVTLSDVSAVTGGLIDASLLRVQIRPTRLDLIPEEISEDTQLIRP